MDILHYIIILSAILSAIVATIAVAMMWNDCTGAPSWDWSSYDYRRKPELKLRPWRTEEVPVGALHNWCGFVSVILAAHDNKMFFLNRTGEVTYNYLDAGAVNGGRFSLDNGETWHPCGVLEQA